MKAQLAQRRESYPSVPRRRRLPVANCRFDGQPTAAGVTATGVLWTQTRQNSRQRKVSSGWKLCLPIAPKMTLLRHHKGGIPQLNARSGEQEFADSVSSIGHRGRTAIRMHCIDSA